MDVGLARLETARRRVVASRAVPPLSKRRFIARLPRRAVLARDRAVWAEVRELRDAGVFPQRPPAPLQPAPSRGSSASPARAPKRRFARTTGARMTTSGPWCGQRGASGPADGRLTAAPDGRETGRW